MCAPIGDGAAAALLCSKEYLEKLPACGAGARRAGSRAVGFAGGKYRELDEPGLTRAASDKAYRMAGLGPEDIDVAEVHDATSFCEIYQSEMLRFCPEARAASSSSRRDRPGRQAAGQHFGRLVSKGHPVGATGLSMLAELATQLRGEAGERQVKGAEIALAENGGGVIGMEEAVAVVILQRD